MHQFCQKPKKTSLKSAVQQIQKSCSQKESVLSMGIKECQATLKCSEGDGRVVLDKSICVGKDTTIYVIIALTEEFLSENQEEAIKGL